MIVHAVIRRPWCVALLPEPVRAPPGRLLASFRARRDARWLMGQGVIDEFRTFSSPIFLAPQALLGRVYDFGIAVAVARDVEMPLDAGWPPVCLGLPATAPAPPDDWEHDLHRALSRAAPGSRSGNAGALELSMREARAGDYRVERWLTHGAAVLATDAPLLPRQLRRLCDEVDEDLVLAYSTGNRLEAADGAPLSLDVVGEATLTEIAESVRRL